jgi:AcrR family transcriptional regulator
MAYEVLKTIGGHQYRYRVESYRDPDTGKVKNRWTYAGRADNAAQTAQPRRSSGEQTRDALASAFLRLLERKALDEATPAAIVREAEVSNATFYRHFRSRDDLVSFCTQRAMSDLNSRLAQLKAIAPSAREERARMRELAIDLVRNPSAPPGLFRAWSVLAPEKVREERHTRRIRAFSDYIDEIVRRGYIEKPKHARRLAFALSMIVSTFIRRGVLEQRMLSEEDYAVVGETFTRLIFLCEA